MAYLIDLLDLQKSMVYNILKGEGFDAISRCRQLASALKIHPPLLGLDAQFYPIERHAYWWRAYGFSFNADEQGYPMISEVILHLRMLRTQIGEDGRVKVWSQEDLGEATGLKKETVYRMEHDRNPLILEHMSRRVAVASALGTLSGDLEPTLFRLFGLDPQAYGVPVPAHDAVAVLHSPHVRLTDGKLKRAHQRQAAFFTDYAIGHAQDAVWEMHERMRQLERDLPLANTTRQHVNVLALLSRYHQLLLLIANEQQALESMRFHAHEAVRLAESATALPGLDEKTGLQTSQELFAAALPPSRWQIGDTMVRPGSGLQCHYAESSPDYRATASRSTSSCSTLATTSTKPHTYAQTGASDLD